MNKRQVGVAAGHELTAQTALDVLQSGGNAADAAIAAFLTAFIAEPCMASAGGGAFANCYFDRKSPIVFDFFCQTPKIKKTNTDFYPIEVDFGEDKETFHIGLGSSAVPGSIAGVFALHEAYGRIPIRELVRPAIEAAKIGVEINDFQALDLQLLQQIFLTYPTEAYPFVKDDRVLHKGDLLIMPELADFLDYLGSEGRNAFYEGEVARKLTDHYAENGGLLTMDDLRSYTVEIRDGLKQRIDHHNTLYTNPLPSVGGSLLVLGRRAMDKRTSSDKLIQGLAVMDEIGNDPISLAQYLSGNLKPEDNFRGSTSHISVLDAWGNAVSLTTTIGEGNGYFIPGTNIHMNNMLGEAALLPNGIHSWTPNVRLSSMMSPSMIIHDSGRAEIILGTGGAGRIPAALSNVIYNYFEKKMSLEDAVEAPRAFVHKPTIHLEPDFVLDNESGYESSMKIKKWAHRSLFFGGVHAVKNDGKTVLSYGDQRRDGIGLTGYYNE